MEILKLFPENIKSNESHITLPLHLVVRHVLNVYLFIINYSYKWLDYSFRIVFILCTHTLFLFF